MPMILLTLLIPMLVDPAKCDENSNKVEVTLPLGTVRAFIERSWKNRMYKSFTRIPFGKPPVGDLRFQKTLRKGLGNITNTVKVKNVQITLEKFAVNKFLKQREKIECTKNVPKTTNENIVKCRRQLKYRIPVQVNETAVGSSSSRNEKSESVHQGMKNKNEDDRIENCFNELNNMKNRSEKHNIATNHNEENDIMIKKDGDNNIASEDENNMTSEDEYNMTSEDKENNAPNAHEENDIASEDERHTDENDLINENVRNRRGTTENDNILISNEELARPLQMSDDSSDEVTEEGIDNFLVRHKNDGHLKLYQRKLLYYLKKDARAEIAYENEPALYSEEGSQDPVPFPKWNKTIDATSQVPLCAQFDIWSQKIVGEEDCLYLNIYVPNTNTKSLFPVMFWIYGGAFQLGSSSKYKAKYLMDKDIVLITVNYRVGPLGFLSSGDKIISGNMGLKDQSLALHWVSKNIKYFQGDPNLITLAGVSSGATSVHFHYLSPMSKGVFQNGISFSGCSLNPWAITYNSSDTIRKLAKFLKCPMDDSESINECLKSRSANDILQSTQDLAKSIGSAGLVFLPVVETVESNYFINRKPIDIIKSGEVADVPWTTGIVKDEGLMKTSGLFASKKKTEDLNKNWETLGAMYLGLEVNVPKSKWASILDSARKHYLGNKTISTDDDSLFKLTKLLGDYLVSIDAQRAARLQATVNKSPVYFYHYIYQAAGSMANCPKTKKPIGISHGDDCSFVFESNGVNPTTSAKDKAMLEEVLNYWSSIITTRKPNVGIPWDAVGSSKDFRYMQIAGPKDYKMVTDNNLSEIQFWTTIGL